MFALLKKLKMPLIPILVKFKQFKTSTRSQASLLVFASLPPLNCLNRQAMFLSLENMTARQLRE